MHTDPIPYGYCHCGCGEKTTRYEKSWAKAGYVKGEPRRYRRGHQGRKAHRYQAEDRGFTTECWIWQLCTDQRGYGYERRGGKTISAHRAYWQDRHGPVPDGLELDHLCRNPSCVNPDHLEPVTHLENVRRGDSNVWRTLKSAAATHCDKGHAWTTENTGTGRTSRYCRACKVQRQRERRAAAALRSSLAVEATT